MSGSSYEQRSCTQESQPPAESPLEQSITDSSLNEANDSFARKMPAAAEVVGTANQCDDMRLLTGSEKQIKILMKLQSQFNVHGKKLSVEHRALSMKLRRIVNFSSRPCKSAKLNL